MLPRAARHVLARHSRVSAAARASSAAAMQAAAPAHAQAAAQAASTLSISFSPFPSVVSSSSSSLLSASSGSVGGSRCLSSAAAAHPSAASTEASTGEDEEGAEPPYIAPNWRTLPDWAEQTQPQIIHLGNLQPRPGSMKKAKRYGRGVGSGLGKTAGKGHKGQGQRKGLRKRGFEGNATPFWRRVPKIGNTTAARYWKLLTPLSVQRVIEFVKAGRIDGNQLITMKTLVDSGCLSKIEHGVKLLSGGLKTLPRPLHFQLTDCSEEARSLLESNGGSVHLVWFNRMTLKAHLHPMRFLQKYGRLPKHTGVPPPKKAAKYGFVVEHMDY